ncbi:MULTISPECIES: DUF389 domain-containing protein [Thiorhodovibrio]|uniref:DUF389 domain-containing protein n=1 Tax=Thiorhodovibrio TaxID=61593 RepID=UPI00191148C3|nr:MULTISPECIES: DUF389 domain-containing protein [Thiorhodovibrio]MBK5969971.1 hypothetical protein [Thiorhodovibrio winogradskyi]WPL12893.1 putative hydrophobic domain protein [Thiorhodovibrio litoralis]
MQPHSESFIQYLSRLFRWRLRLDISSQRAREIFDSIAEGSQPEARFYVMVVVSTLIAGFGLVTNSTAVVIGAMLVAPLMTPIFGISLALVRDDARLIHRAMLAELLGMALAVGMGFVVGATLISVDPYLSITPEMLSRTKPNLADLIVAVLAGLAGAYALLDEKISPALPGVAIATAIVPPLANAGLCLAFGAYSGAIGSFLLFVTNVVSILLISSILFYRAGVHRIAGVTRSNNIIRKVGVTAIGFLLIVGVLTHSLFSITRNRITEHEIKKRLTVELAGYTVSGVDKLLTNIRDGRVHALAQIHAPVKVDPDIVQRLEDQLAEKLQMPVSLVVREVNTNDVSAKGSNVAVVNQSLDGFFIDKAVRPEVRSLQTAETLIKTYLQNHTDLHLVTADSFAHQGKTVILAKIAGFRKLAPAEIDQLQTKIRKQVKEAELELILRFEHIALYNSSGAILPGWETSITPTPEERRIMDTLVSALQSSWKRNPNFLLGSLHQSIEQQRYVILANISGSGVFEKDDLLRMQSDLNELANKPVKLYVWINQGPVMTDAGLVSFLELYQARKPKRNPADMALIERTLNRVR